MTKAANNGLQESPELETPLLLPTCLLPEALPFRHRQQPVPVDSMRALRLTSALVMLLWSLPQELGAQSLAEVARSERSRRAQLPHAAATHTNETLQGYAGRLAASSSPRVEPGPHPGRDSRSAIPPRGAQEERHWSRRFLHLKARLAAAEQRHQALRVKLEDLNLKLQGDPFRQTTLVDPAHVYGPLIAQTERGIQRNRQVLSSARRELAALRERLRQSGNPLSWENSQAGLAPRPASGPTGRMQEPVLRDRAYWQRQLSQVDQGFRSRISPLEIQRFQLVHRRMPRRGESLEVDSTPGLGLPPGVADINRRIRQLRSRHAGEREVLVEQALRSGALPGWFR